MIYRVLRVHVDDGSWSAWTDWNVCSASCGKGYKNRKRNCTYPTLNDDGLPCQGSDTQKVACILNNCPGLYT